VLAFQWSPFAMVFPVAKVKLHTGVELLAEIGKDVRHMRMAHK